MAKSGGIPKLEGKINKAPRLTGCGHTGMGPQGDSRSQISVAWENGRSSTEQEHCVSGIREKTRSVRHVKSVAPGVPVWGTSVSDPGPGSGERRAEKCAGEANPDDPTPARRDAPPSPAPPQPTLSSSPSQGLPSPEGGYVTYLVEDTKPTPTFSCPEPPQTPAATPPPRRP